MGLDAYTKLCSAFDGLDGATSYTDPIAGAYTFVGTAQLDTAQKKFGTGSLYFDGSGSYCTAPDSADWNFGTGDFTIDCWIRVSTSAYQNIVAQAESSSLYWYFSVDSSTSKIRFFARDAGATHLLDGNSSFSLDTWYHVAVVRSSGVGKLYVNGVNVTVSDGLAEYDIPNYADTLKIGYSGFSEYFNGYIDELRISKGIARWKDNFIVPYKPYGGTGTSQLGRQIQETQVSIIA